jgi:hypothetical protein
MSLSSAKTAVLMEKITLEKKLMEKHPHIFPDGSAYRQLQHSRHSHSWIPQCHENREIFLMCTCEKIWLNWLFSWYDVPKDIHYQMLASQNF